MSLHRDRFAADADWRPHPFAVAVYVGGVALLAWSVYAYAQLASSHGGAGPRAEPWRPAISKWSRAPTGGGQRVPAVPAYVALPTAPLAPLLPGASE